MPNDYIFNTMNNLDTTFISNKKPMKTVGFNLHFVVTRTHYAQRRCLTLHYTHINQNFPNRNKYVARLQCLRRLGCQRTYGHVPYVVVNSTMGGKDIGM